MKRQVLTLLLAGTVAPLLAVADTTYSYPKDKPVLSIAVPDDWSVDADETDEKGLVITSPDEQIELDLWALAKHSDPKKTLAEIEENTEELNELIDEHVQGFTVTEKKRGNLNGMEVVMAGGTGKSKEDGSPVTVEVMFLTPDDKQVFGLMYWGSEAAEKANQAALEKISKSLKKP